MQRRVRSEDWHRHDHLRFVIICGSRGSIGFNLQATVRLHCAPERAPVQRYTSPNASSTPLSIPFKPQTKTCVAEDLGCRLASICGLACSVCRCSAMTYVIASSQSFSLIAFGTVYRRSAPAAAACQECPEGQGRALDEEERCELLRLQEPPRRGQGAQADPQMGRDGRGRARQSEAGRCARCSVQIEAGLKATGRRLRTRRPGYFRALACATAFGAVGS